MSEINGPAQRLNANYWMKKMEKKQPKLPTPPAPKWGASPIKGTVYLLDIDNKVSYSKRYYSKKQRHKVIDDIVKYYRLENKPFVIQIDPFIQIEIDSNENQPKHDEGVDGLHLDSQS